MDVQVHHFFHLGAEELQTLSLGNHKLDKILEGIQTIMSNTSQLDTDVQSVEKAFVDLKGRVQSEFNALDTKLSAGDSISSADLSGLEQLASEMTAFHQQIASNPQTIDSTKASSASDSSVSSPAQG